tara:strand:+ start:7076 stop:7441 length:366 start_codon:yes stop_codon:yes gene_type:complete
MVEPSAGTATAFINKLRELPHSENETVSGTYFAGLRVLICMYDNGKPFLPQLVNALNEGNPTTWPTRLQEDVSIRQTLDDIEPAYAARVIDYFLDMISATQMEYFNTVIRTELWVDTATKN